MGTVADRVRDRTRRVAWCAVAIACLGVGSPHYGIAQDSRWPDPGGDPQAPIPVPPDGKYFGLSDDAVLGSNGLTPANYVDAVQRAGGNAIRSRLDWWRVEPTRNGGYNWRIYDDFYELATGSRLTPIFVLSNAPTWARDTVGLFCGNYPLCNFPPAHWEIGAWSRFAGDAAIRYPDAIFEIWNEPNLGAFWFLPHPERYARLQVAAYDAIKAVRPNTMVLSAGFANVSVTTNPLATISMEEFVRRAYAANPSIKGHMDALAFHPFPGLLPDSFAGHPPPLGDDSAWARGFAQLRGVRDVFNDSETPLFITETGISRAQGYSEAAQLTGTRRIYRKALSTPDVQGIIFHRVIEAGDAPRITEVNNGFAWLKYGTGYPAEPFSVYCGFVHDAGNSYSRCP